MSTGWASRRKDPPLLITLFDETVAPGGGDWSWNKVVPDMANTEQAYAGDKSWKFETGSGGGLSAGGITAIDASGATHFTFALYGGTGTAGQRVAVILNDNWTDSQRRGYSGRAVDKVLSRPHEISNHRPYEDRAVCFFKVESTASVIYADRVGFD